ncbi:phosphoesterase family protein [Mycobacterium ulcerans str. Harvey]|uniref:Phosphoesterase family protein n=1 Tax=Mycobacterium ulcerans str. Harvey TaxID=1299332 RepID=A0ABP3ACA0_MYCUL|nr:phosphoesterase family protein [Mycobacterium ulcerans str. Harvey]
MFFLMENRFFDHYFDTLSATDGIDSGSPLFQQKGWNPQTQTIDPAGITMPYRFDTTRDRSSTANASATRSFLGTDAQVLERRG